MIPPPHGFASAEDFIGYEKNITFWIDSSCVRSHVPRVPNGLITAAINASLGTGTAEFSLVADAG